MNNKNSILIAPSILSADFGKMGDEVAGLEQAGADWVHCDVMDGIFVPNITFGFKMISDIKKCTSLPLDVHLMIEKPERYVDRFIDSGADILTLHVEATNALLPTLESIKKRGVRCGAVVSPDTDVKVLREYMPVCDVVLLMSVYPGFGGQKFIEKSYERLREIRQISDELNPEVFIEIDGGISCQNASAVVDAGANVLVAGNSVFGATDRKAAIASLRI